MIKIKKRFKAGKKHVLIRRIFLFLLFFIISIFLGSKIINKFINEKVTEDIIMNYLLGTNYLKLADLYDLNNKYNFFNYALGVEKKTDLDEKNEPVSDDYLEDPNPIVVKEPIVYIYNTHQSEEYQKDFLEPYSIKPTVMLASYMLRERLNDLGIPSIVETNEVKKVLNKNGWKYGKSYRVSRTFLEEAKKQNPTLEIFIDLHRDAGTHKSTTVEINSKNYAKILFVVGEEHDNYQINLNNANVFNEIIKSKAEKLSRGLLQKSGPGVNGVYNQDFDENVFLIEIGGQYNSIDEVKNTIEVLADAIFEYKEGLYD